MTYNEAIEYLNSFINYEEIPSYDYKTSFKLNRMYRLLEFLGNPQKSLKVIHIAGTKGKGSTASFTFSILRAAGLKVGLYTSPHLISFRERIKIDSEEIGEDEVLRLVEEIKLAVGKSKDEDFTFFELYTAMAFVYFRRMKVDMAVIEVGLGGRLDATNTVDSLISCITPISMEHTKQLGPTLRDIAKEKTAIIKKSSVCISAPQEDEVKDIIRSECKEKGARLYEVGKDILYESIGTEVSKTEVSKLSFDTFAMEVFNVFGMFGEYPHLKIGLLGEHQLINAASAIGIIEALRFYNIMVSIESIREGLDKARWPGRLEVIEERPLIILDGAQNRASAKALKNAVKVRFNFDRLILVLGISKDKDIPGICQELEEISDEVILTKANVLRAEEPNRLKEYINKKTYITSNVDEAIKLARKNSETKDLVLITGSLFIVGEAKDLLKKNEKN